MFYLAGVYRGISKLTKLFGYTFEGPVAKTDAMRSLRNCPSCKAPMELFVTFSGIGYDVDRWVPFGKLDLLKGPDGNIRVPTHPEGGTMATNPLDICNKGCYTVRTCFSCPFNPSLVEFMSLLD